MRVLALGVVCFSTVASAPRLSLGLGGAEVGDGIGDAVGLGARSLVAVGLEVRLLFLGHVAHILSEGNKWCCNHLSANALIVHILAYCKYLCKYN